MDAHERDDANSITPTGDITTDPGNMSSLKEENTTSTCKGPGKIRATALPGTGALAYYLITKG